MPSLIDLTNRKFNKLFVINRTKNQGKHIMWNCECDCGNLTIVYSDNLKSGRTKSCGCLKNKKGKDNKGYTGYEEISGARWKKIQNSAKNRNIEFNLDIKYAWDLFIKQGRRCALTGQLLSFSLNQTAKQKKSKYKPFSASLDRIDSSKGYIKNNIQWVHSDINLFKRNLLDEKLILMCNQISNYQRNKYYINNLCPDCHLELAHQEGTEFCYNCGYSKC